MGMTTERFSWDDPITDEHLELALLALRRALGVPAAQPASHEGDWIVLTQPGDLSVDHSGLDVLGVDECRSLIGHRGVARVAFVVGPQPIILTVNYATDDSDVVIRTAAGTKLDAMPGQHVAFQIDGVDVERGHGWSVLVQGKAELIHDPLLIATYERIGLTSMAPGRKPHWIRIRPSHVSGRRLPTASDPEGLVVDWAIDA